MKHRVFVYGTLRSEQANHYLLGTSVCLGEHRTLARYSMRDLGAYPGVVVAGHTAIVGEVYAVNAGQLNRLDRLEGFPRLYDRVLIPTSWGHAWIYVYREAISGRRCIANGDWCEYAATRLRSPRAIFPDGSAA